MMKVGDIFYSAQHPDKTTAITLRYAGWEVEGFTNKWADGWYWITVQENQWDVEPLIVLKIIITSLKNKSNVNKTSNEQTRPSAILTEEITAVQQAKGR